jgi:uncharacterized protein
MKCERCNSTNVRRSSWKRNERDKSHVVYAPYRCRDCEHRFFRVSRTFKGTVAVGIGLLAFLGFIVTMYVVSQPPPVEIAIGTDQGFDPGKKQLLASAKKGRADDQYAVAMMLLQGSEMQQNYGEALKWFLAAAKQGHTGAEVNLGLLYKNGRGVLQDYTQAAQWLQKAATKGNAEAEFHLASLYKIGQGVKHDMKQAYAWYNLAAAQGYEPAVAGRENISTFMSASEVAEAQALSRTLTDSKAPTTNP